MCVVAQLVHVPHTTKPKECAHEARPCASWHPYEAAHLYKDPRFGAKRMAALASLFFQQKLHVSLFFKEYKHQTKKNSNRPSRPVYLSRAARRNQKGNRDFELTMCPCKEILHMISIIVQTLVSDQTPFDGSEHLFVCHFSPAATTLELARQQTLLHCRFPLSRQIWHQFTEDRTLALIIAVSSSPPLQDRRIKIQALCFIFGPCSDIITIFVRIILPLH